MKSVGLCNGKAVSCLYPEQHIIIGKNKNVLCLTLTIACLVSHYELKEATSTFELALWKFKLDQADASNITNRDAYRIYMPWPVKDTMMQYLDRN